MSKKSSDYVRIELPAAVLEHLQKVAEARGKTVEATLADILHEEDVRLAELSTVPKKRPSHTPNAETAKVIREARQGKNVARFKTLNDLFKDLND